MAGLSDIYTPSDLMAILFPQTSAYRPDLPRPMRGMDRSTFGQRHDIASGEKGYGWLGPMQAASGSPMTEYSMTNMPDKYGRLPVAGMGAGRDYPQVTPSLTAEEMQYLLTEPRGLPSIPTRARATDDSIYNKANRWASLRGLQGLSPFID
jgi:hypothetical protein